MNLYKLIIVDDEEISRKGLASLLDWNSIGFEVISIFSDGKEAIEFLKINTIDVVLTDIKMNDISGIEMVRYLREMGNDVEVVFISAYKDFEYARNAIRYNVKHYLLKPIPLKEIIELFFQIKSDLDKKSSTDPQDYKRLLHEKLLVDFISGKSIDGHQDFNRLLNNKCVSIKLTIENQIDDLVLKEWLRKLPGIFSIFFIEVVGKFHNLVGVCRTKMGDSIYRSDLQIAVNNIKKYITREFSITIESVNLDFFNNLIEYNYFLNMEKLKLLKSRSDLFLEVKNIKDNLLKALRKSDEIEVKELFSQVLDALRDEIIKIKKGILIQLLYEINIYLNSLNKNMKDVSFDAFYFDKLFNIRKSENLEQTCFEILNKMLRNARVIYQGDAGISIRKAIQYIEDNIETNLTLEEAAKQAFLSPNYLSRIFSEKLGESFIHYIQRKKIEKAKEYLENKKLKIYEISELIGYSNIKYFYKIFKKYNGNTPTEYRRTI